MSKIEFVAVQQGSGSNKVHISTVWSAQAIEEVPNRSKHARVSCGSRQQGTGVRIIGNFCDANEEVAVAMIVDAYKDRVCSKCLARVGA